MTIQAVAISAHYWEAHSPSLVGQGLAKDVVSGQQTTFTMSQDSDVV